jgi:hypothetical protein
MRTMHRELDRLKLRIRLSLIKYLVPVFQLHRQMQLVLLLQSPEALGKLE